MTRGKFVGAMTLLGAFGASDLAAQSFDACYVPSVGAMYMIKRTGLPGACLAPAHVELNWTAGGGGTVSSVTAGSGLTGGTITASGTVAVDFAGTGSAATVARSDHTHGLAGTSNTAIGVSTLGSNTGPFNTAVGHSALRDNTSGPGNTAVGANALANTTTGTGNTAIGHGALTAYDGAGFNVAIGRSVMQATTGGQENTAVGYSAMAGNVSGTFNTALGSTALLNGGTANTAIGRWALLDATGSRNAALGSLAGRNVTTGNDNIHILNSGTTSDNAVVRIGTQGTQTQTFIAGISGATAASGVAVYVNTAGQLGTLTSSRRAKTDIRDIGTRSRALLALRPVVFRYRPEYDDGSTQLQYGLIAEEVERVMPELVAYRADGTIETVRYHLLVPLLLNELQRQAREIAELRARLPRSRAAPAPAPAPAPTR